MKSLRKKINKLKEEELRKKNYEKRKSEIKKIAKKELQNLIHIYQHLQILKNKQKKL